jgi:putative spermidine/putrescine transport system substrate-binding protein
MKKKGIAFLIMAVAILGLTGCGNRTLDSYSDQSLVWHSMFMGKINSIGMPDSWGNWSGIWGTLESHYHVSHEDKNMTSGEELAAFKSTVNNAPDIGDVGSSYALLATQNGLVQPYKGDYWDKIPSNAKDSDGNWVIAYYGTVAMLINKDVVGDNVPTSFADVLAGDYPVVMRSVDSSNQAECVLLSAAIANGGSETNLKPGFSYFATLAKNKRLTVANDDSTVYQKIYDGKAGVAFMWDFNALNGRDYMVQAGSGSKIAVNIPQDGAVKDGYATIINANARNPYGAALTRDYLLSEEGQIDLARGHMTPVRTDVTIPDDVKATNLDSSQYKKVSTIKNPAQWISTCQNLDEQWESTVAPYL